MITYLPSWFSVHKNIDADFKRSKKPINIEARRAVRVESAGIRKLLHMLMEKKKSSMPQALDSEQEH